jgi:hypothetical protein
MLRFVFILLLTASSPFFTGCKKDCFYNARVIEYDYRKCACCGGLVVEVEGKTYQAFVYPESLSPDVKTNYPYDVNIEFKSRAAGDGCSVYDGLIDITRASFK